jgi:hypothetical protein
MSGSLLEHLKRYATAFFPYGAQSFGLRHHCRLRFATLIGANYRTEWGKLVLTFPPSCHKRGKLATPSHRGLRLSSLELSLLCIHADTNSIQGRFYERPVYEGGEKSMIQLEPLLSSAFLRRYVPVPARQQEGQQNQ